MNKVKINALVNILLFFVFLISCFSGIVLWLVLPSGQGFQGGRGALLGSVFWELTRQNWKDIHNYSSLVLIFLVLIHLILRWNYIKNLPKLIKEG